MSSARLAGSVCLVTGATSGIGRAIALRFGTEDVRLLLSGRDLDLLEEVTAATGGAALAADLREPGAGKRLGAAALEVHGRVDVLVNAAGCGQYGPVTELRAEELEELVRVNIAAPIELASSLLPGMIERQSGHIVTIGSISGRLGRRNEAAYAATKAALSVFSESLRDEVAGTGVAVSLVTLGAVDTSFFARRGAPYDRSWPRPLHPETVAEQVVDLLGSRRAEVIVPRWLNLPLRLRGALPELYHALARRFD